MGAAPAPRGGLRNSLPPQHRGGEEEVEAEVAEEEAWSSSSSSAGVVVVAAAPASGEGPLLWASHFSLEPLVPEPMRWFRKGVSVSLLLPRRCLLTPG